MADLYRRRITELQALLTDETDRPEAMATIRALIERIEVHAGAERGKPDIVLIGALANILAFGQQSKTAASMGDGGRVLMVAGACNHRNLPVEILALFSEGAIRPFDVAA